MRYPINRAIYSILLLARRCYYKFFILFTYKCILTNHDAPHNDGKSSRLWGRPLLIDGPHAPLSLFIWIPMHLLLLLLYITLSLSGPTTKRSLASRFIRDINIKQVNMSSAIHLLRSSKYSSLLDQGPILPSLLLAQTILEAESNLQRVTQNPQFTYKDYFHAYPTPKLLDNEIVDYNVRESLGSIYFRDSCLNHAAQREFYQTYDDRDGLCTIYEMLHYNGRESLMPVTNVWRFHARGTKSSTQKSRRQRNEIAADVNDPGPVLALHTAIGFLKSVKLDAFTSEQAAQQAREIQASRSRFYQDCKSVSNFTGVAQFIRKDDSSVLIKLIESELELVCLTSII